MKASRSQHTMSLLLAGQIGSIGSEIGSQISTPVEALELRNRREGRALYKFPEPHCTRNVFLDAYETYSS